MFFTEFYKQAISVLREMLGIVVILATCGGCGVFDSKTAEVEKKRRGVQLGTMPQRKLGSLKIFIPE